LLNPETGALTYGSTANNSFLGYYADGYFDRNTILQALGGRANSAVNPTSANVGYIGRLYYNPRTNASLFLPSAGWGSKSGDETAIGLRGQDGMYQTSSSISGTENWVFLSSQTITRGYVLNRVDVASVRCIKDE
jgi:hypothetical protein